MLADLKFISCNTTRYSRGPRTTIRAVDRRSRILTSEYNRRAKNFDTEYGGVDCNVVGPVQAHLQRYGDVRGYVVGHWGEVNEDLHSLVHDLASARVVAAGLMSDRVAGSLISKEEHLALVIGSLRRQLSVVGVRSYARLLLDRKEGLTGEGGSGSSLEKSRSSGYRKYSCFHSSY